MRFHKLGRNIIFMNRELHSSITEGKQDKYMTENFVWEKTVVVRCKWKRCKWNMGANEVFFSKLSDFTQMDQGHSVRIIVRTSRICLLFP